MPFVPFDAQDFAMMASVAKGQIPAPLEAKLAELQPFNEVKQRNFLEKLSGNPKIVGRILQVLRDVPLVSLHYS